MLVLTRKEGDRVFVKFRDIRIVVTILEMHGGKVRLGFDAPLEVAIDREEVHKSKIEHPRTK